MIIKFDSIKDHTWQSKKGKEFTGKLVKGTRVDNDKEWKKEIFSNQEDIINSFSEFGTGEVIEVKFKQEKGFWNFDRDNLPKIASDEMIAKAKEGFQKSNPTEGRSAKDSVRNPKWDGRTGEQWNRSAALYLAFDFLKYNKDLATKKADKEVFEKKLFAVANTFFDYIDKGKVPVKGSGSDELNPPV